MIKRVVTIMVALAVICGAHGAPYGGLSSWLSGAEAQAATIQLPQTGQTSCYDAAGVTIACAGTGQDGEIRAGAAWLNPRFTANTNQTVTDNLTGLVWSKDANPAGTAKTWQQALDYIKTLNSQKYLGYSDWRLPNINEIASLVNKQQSNQATWLNTQIYSNVQANFYWSSNTLANTTNIAWNVNLEVGYVYFNYKTVEGYAWPVRGGQSGLISLPKTGQTSCSDLSGTTRNCSGTGEDGELQVGSTWPTPRFSDNSINTIADLTVTDNLTGLIWTKSGNLASGTKNWQQALDYIRTLNSGSGYLGHTDWRLPNANELASLLNKQPSNLATWLNAQGFTDVQPQNYWSSDTFVSNASNAWYAGFYDAGLHYLPKSDQRSFFYVWPVRGGQINTTPTNAACGTANGTTITAAPTANLCTSGTASAVTGTGPWYWNCSGSNGGVSTSCSANSVATLTGTVNQVDVLSCPQVKLYVSAVDQAGSPLSGLTSANFVVKEDGVTQTPLTVTTTSTQNAPASIALALDYSGSMSGTPVTDMQNAAVNFINQLGTQDAAELVKFSTTAQTVQGFSSNKTALAGAVTAAWSGTGSNTALYDAVYQGISETALRGGRMAVIAMTDGYENASSHSATQVIDLANSKGVPVFTIGLGSVDTAALQKLATGTGGQYYYAPTSADLQAIYNRIANIINNQYIITYTTTGSGTAGRTAAVSVSSGGNSVTASKLYSGCGVTTVPGMAGDGFDVITDASGTTKALNLSAIIRIGKGDVGKSGKQFVVANLGSQWFLHNGSSWVAYSGGVVPSYSSGLLPAQTSLVFLTGQDVSGLGGLNLFAGYGSTVEEMLAAARVKLFFTIPAASGNLGLPSR
ncbi:MAG TPA: VWA domain-containing protein [Desulfuromonadales bacterium]|nr:VWA domain-containing protein [Desulfuromonadales bacterium]